MKKTMYVSTNANWLIEFHSGWFGLQHKYIVKHKSILFLEDRYIIKWNVVRSFSTYAGAYRFIVDCSDVPEKYQNFETKNFE